MPSSGCLKQTSLHQIGARPVHSVAESGSATRQHLVPLGLCQAKLIRKSVGAVADGDLAPGRLPQHREHEGFIIRAGHHRPSREIVEWWTAYDRAISTS